MPQQLPDELLGDILLRLPADDPACFIRASLVHKRWYGILADPAFRRRHRELHPAAPVLGFFRIVPSGSSFVPVDRAASRRPAARDFPGWRVLDCRHGRALFVDQVDPAFLVWDPLTRKHQVVPRPNNCKAFTAAVLCAAATEGCDHRGCHGGPFRVLFIFSFRDASRIGLRVTSACVFSSATGGWSEPTSVQHPRARLGARGGSTLLQDRVYFDTGYALDSIAFAFEYQLGAHRLSVMELPSNGGKIIPPISGSGDDGEMCFIHMEDEDETRRRCPERGGRDAPPHLCLWSRDLASGGTARWARCRIIELERLFPGGAVPYQSIPIVYRKRSVYMLGFAEGTDAIIVGTSDGGHRQVTHILRLNSGMASGSVAFYRGSPYSLVFPYTSCCIPVTDTASTDERSRQGVSSA